MKLFSKKRLILMLVLSLFVMGSPANLADNQAEGTNEIEQIILMPVDQLTLGVDQLVAENDDYKLYMDEIIGHVRIEHKWTRQVWYSSPPQNEDLPPNIIKTLENPIQIRYTEAGTSFSLTNPIAENAEIIASSIEAGVRFDYHMEATGLSLAMEYRLTDSGMEMTIPFDSIKETGNRRFVSLEPTPFMEAASPQSNGALFMPDGSGAIMTIKENHPVYFTSYNEFIYGGDHAFQKNIYQRVTDITREITVKPTSENIAMPVFGLYKDGKGFLGIVTEGDSNAKIKSIPSGIRNIRLFRTSIEFLYRNDDVTFVGSSGEIAMVERNLIAGDRTIKYVLVQDDEANYVGMAKKYRDYLIEEKGLQPIEEENYNLQLRLFGGALRNNVIGSTFMKLTTFEQAQTIIDSFIEKGITSIEVTYDGWSSGGKFGNQPQHFSASRSLGGNKELERLAEYLNDNGIHLYLKANYVKPFSGSKAVKPKRDAINGLNKEVMEVFLPWIDTRQMSRHMFYYLNPERVFDRYILKEASQYANLGIHGVHLDYMGDTLYSDHKKTTPFLRAQTIEVWQKSLDLMREQSGHTSVDYGFAYVLGHVDRIDNIPVDSSHFTYQDRPVPFYQIAIHGLIPYTAKPTNLVDDPRIHFLRMLEYGAAPSYELTYERSSLLRETLASYLFSSAYTDWNEYALEEYSRLVDILGPLSNQFITNHEQLQLDIFRTTYGNGTQIIVNYNREEQSVLGQKIEPYGYVVLRGEEQL